MQLLICNTDMTWPCEATGHICVKICLSTPRFKKLCSIIGWSYDKKFNKRKHYSSTENSIGWHIASKKIAWWEKKFPTETSGNLKLKLFKFLNILPIVKRSIWSFFCTCQQWRIPGQLILKNEGKWTKKWMSSNHYPTILFDRKKSFDFVILLKNNVDDFSQIKFSQEYENLPNPYLLNRTRQTNKLVEWQPRARIGGWFGQVRLG